MADNEEPRVKPLMSDKISITVIVNGQEKKAFSRSCLPLENEFKNLFCYNFRRPIYCV